jgi:hypothetical protein
MEDLSGVFLKSFSAEDVPAFFERTMQRVSQDLPKTLAMRVHFRSPTLNIGLAAVPNSLS